MTTHDAEAAPGDGHSHAGDEAGRRLADVEARLARLEALVEDVKAAADRANHLASMLEAQGLGALAVDLQRMAATVWDEVAVSRRLARLEDLLLERQDAADST